MPLRTRITLLALIAAMALALMVGAIAWQRDRVLSERYHGVLLQSQSIAWSRLQDESGAALRAGVAATLQQASLERAWQARDRQALNALVRPLLEQHPGWRADWFDEQRALVQSSSSSLLQDAMVDAGWLSRALSGSAPLLGLSQASRELYYLVATQSFGPTGARGVLALGQDLSELLPQMAHAIEGESFVVNLRGREVTGTQVGLAQAEGLAQTVRHARVLEGQSASGRHWLTATLPLIGPDGRPIGSLLSVWDTTAQRSIDRRMQALAVAGIVLLIGLLGFALSFVLRRALRPLDRSVGVLRALAQGDLRAAPDEDDQELPDEAGQIARGVAALRGEMINLRMLRDERGRVRQQQERLIRRELRQLAGSLDEESRTEVLAALEPVQDTEDDNALAGLANTLGRLSGLVVSQQDRLIDLLKRLRKAMAEQEVLISLRQELEIARTMQLSILPRTEPETGAVHVSSLMIPAKEVGGDFYDYFLLEDNRLALVIADVSGKGIPAAFFMAISRTLLKSIAQFLREPADIMARLNDRLCAENEQMMFVTTFLGVLDLDTGRLDYVNGGHNPPLLLRSGGEVQMLPQGQNIALAVVEGMPFKPGTLAMARGDTLLLYTDGVTEAANAAGELFGEPRLVQAVSARSAKARALPQDILQAVRDFESGAAQADDITVVAVRYLGATGGAGGGQEAPAG
ncbi:PP2C family protein-serine/threonine phosphatase [Comamonas flocculans]|uniref:SpoIIE family protein phosphatase n=1 Tax=Comamonas flocculans TaxID=2597701 RepID=A0A5B8RUJ1_9BURK|nr:PP2C family protein-serine/threonine phosphatase [Comamonas flocculans]QEA13150.1 SpoIIE family protein phosphatase [Comamonas flocculans]